MFMWAGATRCEPLHDFWFASQQESWPLAGIFFLIFFLLMALHIFVAFSPSSRRKGDKVILAASFITLAAVLVSLSSLDNASTMSFYKENRIWEDWLRVREPRWLFDDLTECDLVLSYVGRWEVVEKDIPSSGFEFPMKWIEFHKSFTFSASNSRWAKTYEGDFGFSVMGSGWITGPDFDGPWEFELDDDQLVLTTPESLVDLPKSRVVLKRVTND